MLLYILSLRHCSRQKSMCFIMLSAWSTLTPAYVSSKIHWFSDIGYRHEPFQVCVEQFYYASRFYP